MVSLVRFASALYLLCALLSPLSTRASAPASGELLVFSARCFKPNNRGQMSHFHLYTARPDAPGSRRQWTTGKSDDVRPHWLSDKRHIVFLRSWQNGKPGTVCALDTQTGSIRTIFTLQKGNYLQEISFSPDGRQIIIAQGRAPGLSSAQRYNSVWLVALRSGRARRLEQTLQSVYDGMSIRWISATQVLLKYETMSPPFWKIMDLPSGKTRRSGNTSAEVSPLGNYLLVQKATVTARDVTVLGLHSSNVWHWKAPSNDAFTWLDNDTLVSCRRTDAYPDPPNDDADWGEPTAFFLFGRTGKALRQNTLTVGAHAKTFLAYHGREVSDLNQFERLPGRSDGFLLGTWQHRHRPCVMLWVLSATGEAQPWNRLTLPHFSPSGKWFAAQSGYQYRFIGAFGRRTMHEFLYPLYAARRDAPTHAYLITPGLVYVDSYDWR